MTNKTTLTRRALLAGVGAVSVTALLTHRNATAELLQNESSLKTQPLQFSCPPVLQQCRPNHAHILVITNRPAVVKINYGQPGQLNQTVYVTVHGQIDIEGRQNCIALTGLQPGMKYEYLVTATELIKFTGYRTKWGQELKTAPLTFTTPSSNAKTIRFSILNDIHQKLGIYRDFMKQISQERCDFLALNGDMLNDPANENQVIDNVFVPLDKQASSLPLEFVRGNHECRGTFSRHFSDSLPMPDEKYYYTFRQGPIQFVVMDTGEDKTDDHKEYFGLAAFEEYHKIQTRWLAGVLQSNAWKDAPFRVVLAHIPIRRVTQGREWNISKPHQHTWMNMFASHQLDLMICGHTHRYEVVKKSDEPGYPMIIGGGPVRGKATRIAIEANEKQMVAQVFSDDGKMLDELRYDKQS